MKRRRELWDHTLPLANRSRDIIATHWQEISKEFNGKFNTISYVLSFNYYLSLLSKYSFHLGNLTLGILTPDAACKKWRYLKDSYMRIRNDIIKKKSGSAANKLVKWKWYEYMRFLHDTQDSHKLVYSNII